MESKLNLLNPATSIAWQKKIRDDREKAWISREKFWEYFDLNLGLARIKETSRPIAEKIILEYEWLGTLAPVTKRYFGLFFGQLCGGVECISVTGWGLPREAGELGVHYSRLAYLSRGACAFWTPRGSASKLISWTLKLLRQDGYRVAIAFSDEMAGEIGTVYQSTNWYYVGQGPESKVWISKNGRILGNQGLSANVTRSKSHISYSEYKKILIQNGWTQIKFPGKHKYYFILSENQKERQAILDRIGHKIRPYPKRAAEVKEDTPGFQPGEGGATPTRPL